MRSAAEVAVQEAGSLDNDFFFYGEDIEWCHRLRQHGWKVAVDPAARITHIKGGATRGERRGAQVEMLLPGPVDAAGSPHK